MAADLLDNANELTEFLLNNEITRIKSQACITLPAIGKCHWCEEPLDNQQRFCDSDCSQDYEKYHQQNP